MYRSRMGWALRGTQSPDALPFLERCLTGEMKTNAEIVLGILLDQIRAFPDREEALRILLIGLEHKSPGIRRHAANRLNQLRVPRVEMALAVAVQDEDAGTAATAARYLAACEGLDLTEWLALAAAEPTHARYIAARPIIAEVESHWRISEGKLAEVPWPACSGNPETLEQFRKTIRAWEEWARKRPTYSANFFAADRAHWPKSPRMKAE
jgi:hypothetical protein